MFDPKIFDDILKNIHELVPEGVKDAERDVKQKLRNVVQDGFARMDLVSREEFSLTARHSSAVSRSIPTHDRKSLRPAKACTKRVWSATMTAAT